LPNYESIIAHIAVPTPTLTSNVIRQQLSIATQPMKVGMPMVVEPSKSGITTKNRIALKVE